MYSLISDLIAKGNISEASGELSKLMERDGFNDRIAVLLSVINSAIGNDDAALLALKKGLEFNSKNYELHLCMGDYYRDRDLEIALREYDFALAYAGYEVGEAAPDYEYIRNVKQDFINEKESLYKDYINSLPILIYKSEAICYGVLNRFADMLKEGLLALGERVEILDVSVVPPESVADLCGNRYKAILGIQTYVFSIRFKDGRNIHDFIFGPKYNMVFDHPCCMFNHFTKGPKDYIVLTHDRNYEKFIKGYYPMISSVAMLPPGGERFQGRCAKEYELSFIGSYKSPDTWDGVISELDRKYDGRAKRLIELMDKSPNRTYEDCLLEVFDGKADAETFYDLKQTYFAVMSKKREEILVYLLENGIGLHVFGDSFKAPVFSKYPNLFIHPELTPEDSLNVYAASKATLNIMSWHKDGRTERVANAMFNMALVISDKCDYLSEKYVDGDDIILFDLEDYSDLAERIQKALNNEAGLFDMVSKAFAKAIENDSWETRAAEFLHIIGDKLWRLKA